MRSPAASGRILERPQPAQPGVVVEQHLPVHRPEVAPGQWRAVADDVGHEPVVVRKDAALERLPRRARAADARHPVLALPLVLAHQGDGREVETGELPGAIEHRAEDRLEVAGAVEVLDGLEEPALLIPGAADLHQHPLDLDGAEDLSAESPEQCLVAVIEWLGVHPVGEQHAAELSPGLCQRHGTDAARRRSPLVPGDPPQARGRDHPHRHRALQHPRQDALAGEHRAPLHPLRAAPAIVEHEGAVVRGEQERGAGVGPQRELADLEHRADGALHLLHRRHHPLAAGVGSGLGGAGARQPVRARALLHLANAGLDRLLLGMAGQREPGIENDAVDDGEEREEGGVGREGYPAGAQGEQRLEAQCQPEEQRRRERVEEAHQPGHHHVDQRVHAGPGEGHDHVRGGDQGRAELEVVPHALAAPRGHPERPAHPGHAEPGDEPGGGGHLVPVGIDHPPEPSLPEEPGHGEDRRRREGAEEPPRSARHPGGARAHSR